MSAPHRPHPPAAPAAGAAPPAWRRALAWLTPLDGLIVLVLLGLAATLAVPSIQVAGRAANEEAAQGFIREVHRLEQAFKAKQTGSPRYAESFFELAASGVYQGPPPEGGTVVRQGYIFKIWPLDRAGERYFATGKPVRLGETGTRSFYVDDSGVVRSAPGLMAGPVFPEVR